MRHHHYVTSQGLLIRITAKRQPALKSIPRSTTWVVYEYHEGRWLMPACPEITWGGVYRMNYLGSLPVTKEPPK